MLLGYAIWRAAPKRLRATAGISRAHAAVIRVYDEAGNVIETHEHKSE